LQDFGDVPRSSRPRGSVEGTICKRRPGAFISSRCDLVWLFWRFQPGRLL